jgi:hypothetical protein
VSDGAHLGVSAGRAIETIIGGADPPTEDEQMSVGEFHAWLLQPDLEPLDYEECARRAAREILLYFLADPRRANAPGETEYDWDADPDHGSHGMKPEYVKALSVYEEMKEAGYDLGDLGLTGFQWGWALNAARRCVELGPLPNPAILTVDVRDP